MVRQDIARALRLALLPLGVSGCAVFSVPRVPELDPIPAPQALREARDGNWRVRVATPGGEIEGRSAFVTDSTAEIGGHRVRLAEVQRLDRRALTDLGGRPTGAVVGGLAGFVVGHIAESFYEFGAERQCDAGCAIGIYVPAIIIDGLLGAMIGSAVSPPHSRWITVWRRP